MVNINKLKLYRTLDVASQGLEGDGFPQVLAMVSLVCPWLVLTPRVLQLCTNHLVWVVCRRMWVKEACQLFLVPSWSSNMPFYPSKCCELRNVPRFFLLPLFPTWTHIWVLGGVRNVSPNNCQVSFSKQPGPNPRTWRPIGLVSRPNYFIRIEKFSFSRWGRNNMKNISLGNRIRNQTGEEKNNKLTWTKMVGSHMFKDHQ